jgi:transposase InsO family protein
VATSPDLHVLDSAKKIAITCDSSIVGVGACLFQPSFDDELPNPQNIIAFRSRSLKPYERRYPIYRLELLSLLFALHSFHDYVYGQQFIVYTDHKALSYMHTQPKLNRILSNWLDTILLYDFELRHLPGHMNDIADALSRAHQSSWGLYTPPTSSSFTSVNKVIISEDQLTLVKQQLIDIHNFGHFGEKSVYMTAKKKGISAPNLIQLVKEVLQNCQTCNQWSLAQVVYEPLKPIFAKMPWDHVQIDLVTSFPTVNNLSIILVVVDVFTSYTLLRALPDKNIASLSNALWNIFCDFDAPRILQSDNEPALASDIVENLIEQHGTEHRMISAYNPQANGKVEKFCQTVSDCLRKLLSGVSADWPTFLPFAQLCINNKIRDSTSATPFYLFFNRTFSEFQASTALSWPISQDDLHTWQLHQKKCMDELFPVIRQRIQKNQQQYSNSFNARKKMAKLLQPDTVVMITDVHRSNKNEPRFVGPYVIVSRQEEGSYLVKDSAGAILKRSIPIQQMKVLSLIKESDLQDSYGVDFISAHRKKDGKTQYLVHWTGYDQPSWENVSNIEDHSLIKQYMATHSVSKRTH